MLLFILTLSLNPPPRVVIEDKKIIPELTLSEPIRAPSFAKIDLLTPIVIKPVINAVKQASAQTNMDVAPAGWYSPTECTGYVASRRPVGKWHNAITWPSMARAEGYYVGSQPRAGAIGQRGNHVVYVERVRGNLVYISERNYDYRGSYREMWRPISYYTYIY